MPLNKLTQAAWRLRQIEKRQCLKLVAPEEVERLIWRACGLEAGTTLTAAHIIRWAVVNTETLNIGVRCCCTVARVCTDARLAPWPTGLACIALQKLVTEPSQAGVICNRRRQGGDSCQRQQRGL